MHMHFLKSDGDMAEAERAKQTAGGSAPANTGTPGKRTRSEVARLASLARWGKYKAKGKQKGKGRAKSAKPTAEEKEAVARQEAQANRAKLLGENAAAMDTLAMGQQPDAAQGEALVAAGLADKLKDGTIVLNTAGRQAYNAASGGDAGRVAELTARAKDAMTPAEAKPEEEKPKGGGGGGSGKDKPTPDEKQQAKLEERAKRASETARRVGLEPDDVSALQQGRDNGGAENERMRDLGLLDANGDTTDQGRRALAALELGNVGGFRAALQDASARLEREAQARQRAIDKMIKDAEREAETNKPRTTRRTRELRNGIEITTRETKMDEIKQSAQDRAMFANMGGGRGSGGGGGAGKKPSGGIGGLWKVDPKTGKRSPEAGLEKGAPPSAPDKPSARTPTKPTKPPASPQVAKLEKRKAAIEKKLSSTERRQQSIAIAEQNHAQRQARQRQIDTELQAARGNPTLRAALLAESRALIKESQQERARLNKGQTVTPRATKDADMDEIKYSRRHSASDEQHLKRAVSFAVGTLGALRDAGAPMNDDKPIDANEPLTIEIKALDLQTQCDLVCDAICEVIGDEKAAQEDCDITVYAEYAVLDIDGETYQINYTIDSGDVQLSDKSEWARVEWEISELDGAEDGYEADDDDTPRVVIGDAVKMLDEGKIGAYAVRFGDADNPDLSQMRDYFTKATDFWLDAWTQRPMLYHHAQDEATADVPIIGTWTKAMRDDVGIWLEGQLDKAHKYYSAINEMVKQGALKLSSDSAPHLVKRTRRGDTNEVTRWPLMAASLTPTPAEPRLLPVSALKAIYAAEFPPAYIDSPETDSIEMADAMKMERERLMIELDLLELEYA